MMILIMMVVMMMMVIMMVVMMMTMMMSNAHKVPAYSAIIIKIKLSKQPQPSISRLNSRLLGQWNMSTQSGGQAFLSYNGK